MNRQEAVDRYFAMRDAQMMYPDNATCGGCGKAKVIGFDLTWVHLTVADVMACPNILAGVEFSFDPRYEHAFVDDGSDPGNCCICHFVHRDPRGGLSR